MGRVAAYGGGTDGGGGGGRGGGGGGRWLAAGGWRQVAGRVVGGGAPGRARWGLGRVGRDGGCDGCWGVAVRDATRRDNGRGGRGVMDTMVGASQTRRWVAWAAGHVGGTGET